MEAALVCEQGLSLSTGNDIPASWFRRTANIFMNCQKYEEALMTYQEALRLDPGIADRYFYQNKGHALEALKRYEEARIAYQEAVRLSMPDPDPGLCYSLAIVFDRLAEQAREMAAQIRQGGSHGTSSS
jgi:tetratricopeptide (TPR) repeat protein